MALQGVVASTTGEILNWLGVAAVVFAGINARLQQQLRARALSDDLTGALSRRGPFLIEVALG